MTRYIAIGDDGRRPVVWGLGVSPSAARESARYWLSRSACDPAEADAMDVRPCSDEAAERIILGDVSVPSC